MSFDVPRKLTQKIIIFTIFFKSALYAGEEVTVITADRIKSNVNKSTSDVRIITTEEIKKSSIHTLPELLSKESDLIVTNSGPNGSNSSLFLRGTDSAHTLVVIDGIVMNDPSNPNRQFDIGRLSLNNIERIEVLKGSQGLAYGSNAIGGVVVITTKKAKSKFFAGESFVDYGTFNTVNLGTNFQKYLLDNLGLSMGADYMNTRGFSAASEKVNSNAERDGDQRLTIDLGLILDFSEQYSIETNTRFTHNKADLDKGGGVGSDDPNDLQKEEEIYSKLQLTKNWESGNAQTKITYNFTKHYRLLEVLSDPNHPEASNSKTTGEINTISVNHTNYIKSNLVQNLNFDLSEENDQSGHSNRNMSIFAYHQYELESEIYNFGLRLDKNKYLEDHFTYKIAIGHKFQSSLLKLAFSTGFRQPSLNQLYAPIVGNKNLQPEKSQSTDLSYDKNISESTKAAFSIFYTNINNRLSFNPNNFFNINLGRTEIIGIENKINTSWTTHFYQSLSFTLLKARDLNLGKKLARRPEINVKNNFVYILGNIHSVDLEISHTGKRNDVDNLGASVKMNSYILTNLNYRYTHNSKNEFYVKIKNLANSDYEEIYGFGTGGRIVTAGINYNF